MAQRWLGWSRQVIALRGCSLFVFPLRLSCKAGREGRLAGIQERTGTNVPDSSPGKLGDTETSTHTPYPAGPQLPQLRPKEVGLDAH